MNSPAIAVVPPSTISSLLNALGEVILGKSQQTQLALTCMLAGGHLLLEDLPGMGKTTLAHGLAKVLGLEFQRVQFTSDLLPADIVGTAIFKASENTFHFHRGPVFTHILLADEINRASPKTQSALLEAMGEYQVTVDGETHVLPNPFFVIATQNPLHQSGTFPLPESQLDRFMMRISLGYPTAAAERRLLEQGGVSNQEIDAIGSLLSFDQLRALQAQVQQVSVSPSVLDYLQRLLAYTRESADFVCGLSPRGALAWLHCAKAWALIQQRDYVIPDDLQALMLSVTAHRLLPQATMDESKVAIDQMMRSVSVME